MTDSLVRIVVGSVLLAGAAAGAAGVKPAAAAAQLASTISTPAYLALAACAIGVLTLTRLLVGAGQKGRHRA